jgi:hypothetical protein
MENKSSMAQFTVKATTPCSETTILAKKQEF